MRKAADPGEQLQDVRKLAANKKCFDCGHSGTTYVIADLGIFVCSICAGIHREFSHRAKGLSMSNFSQAEVDKLISTGNEKAGQNWMARHNPRTHPIPDVKDLSRLKEFMRQKYIEKRFYGEPREEEKEQKSWAQFENQKTEVRPVTTQPLDNIRPTQKPQNLLDMDEPPASKPLTQPTPIQTSQPQPKPVLNLFPATTNHTNGHLTNGLTPNTDSSSSVPKLPHPNLFPIPAPTSPMQFPTIAPPQSAVQTQPQYSPTYPPQSAVQTQPQYSPTYPPQPAVQTQPQYSPTYPPAPQYPTATSPTLPNAGFFPAGMHNPYNVQTSPNNPVGNAMYPNPVGGFPGMNYPTSYPPVSNVPSYIPNQPNMTGSSSDPFDSIIEEERMTKLHEQQEKARKMSNNQNIFMQQYLVQAQLYQQTYGVPYPYSFQQWYSIMHSQPNQAPASVPHPNTSGGNPNPQTHSAVHHQFTTLSNLGSSQGSNTTQDSFSGVKNVSQKSNNPFDMFS